MIEEEGNKVLFQVVCSFATGRASVGQAEHLWDVRGEQSDAVKIMLEPKMNTEMKHIDIKLNTLNFCWVSYMRKPFIPKEHEMSQKIKIYHAFLCNRLRNRNTVIITDIHETVL